MYEDIILSLFFIGTICFMFIAGIVMIYTGKEECESLPIGIGIFFIIFGITFIILLL
jgi:hypothetical protein